MSSAAAHPGVYHLAVVPPPMWPAFATSLGAILFAMAAERKKRRRQAA